MAPPRLSRFRSISPHRRDFTTIDNRCVSQRNHTTRLFRGARREARRCVPKTHRLGGPLTNRRPTRRPATSGQRLSSGQPAIGPPNHRPRSSTRETWRHGILCALRPRRTLRRRTILGAGAAVNYETAALPTELRRQRVQAAWAAATLRWTDALDSTVALGTLEGVQLVPARLLATLAPHQRASTVSHVLRDGLEQFPLAGRSIAALVRTDATIKTSWFRGCS